MPSLEEVLLKSGAMTEAQLEIVKTEMARLGGSLDLNILALGYLTEEALQRFISQVFPPTTDTDFRLEPEREALALVSRETAQELEVVPQRLVGMKLHTLMHSPDALTRLDELSGLEGFDLVAVGVNEVRLHHLLHRCYGTPREPRYGEIMDRLLARAEARSAERQARLDSLIGDPLAGLDESWMAGAVLMESAAPEPEATTSPRPPIPPTTPPLSHTPPPLPSRPHPGGPEMPDSLDRTDAEVVLLMDDDLIIEVIEGEEPAEAEAATGEASDEEPSRALEEAHQTLATEDFRAALDQINSMDEIPDLFFRFGVPHFKSVALFKVQSNMVMGWRGAGLGMVSEHIRGIVVPVQSDTFLARAIEQGIYTGQSEGSPVEERILEQLGASPDAYVITGGMQVANRPVLVVCGITEGSDPPNPKVMSDLSQICDQASEAIFRIILERKKSKAQDSDAGQGGPDADGDGDGPNGATSTAGAAGASDPQPKRKSPRKKTARKKAT